jgi:hypothetical protein
MYTPTTAQKAKAQKRREEFAALTRTIKTMSADEIQALADEFSIVTIEDHPLSPTNTVLLTYQRKDVTVVGGFQQWKKHGRTVIKGEHGLAIWIPSIKDEKNDPAKEEEKKELFFLMGTVFDVSQTEVAKEQPNG